MKLYDLICPAETHQAVRHGYVVKVHHPTEPLALLNYTNKCQFEGKWNATTRQCRGLIYNTETNDVVARPFPKFFNLYEHGPDSKAGPIELKPPFRVSEKLDGSLGIAYRCPSDGRVAWATRGSFTSEQALWATRWWNENGEQMQLNCGRYTFLAEIIYPANRIVVDYGDYQGLKLIDVIRVEDGESIGPFFSWPGGIVESYRADEYDTADPNERDNFEGYVVTDSLGQRVKIKSAEYMRLHKTLSGLSEHRVWEMMSNGDDLSALYDIVPDEWAHWLKETEDRLLNRWAHHYRSAKWEFRRINDDPDVDDRKKFAAMAAKSPYKSVLFAILDHKDWDQHIWKMIEPKKEAA